MSRAVPFVSSLAAIALAAGLVGCKSPTASSGGSDGSGGSTSTARAMPTVDGPSAQGDVIKIGLIASLNGASKPWGEDCKSGAQLAVDLVNQAGGINGKKLELLIEDSNSQPADGRNATQKIVSEGVICVLGEVASGITRPMTEVTYAAGVPQVAIGATAVDITQKYGNVFRVCYNDDFQGPVMAKFAFDELKVKNVAVMTDNKLPYSQGLSASFKAAFEKLGGKIVSEEFYEQGNAQFTGQITNLKAKNPDGIFLSGYFNEVGPIAKQLRQNDVNVPLFGGDGWDSSELINSGGEAIVGGFFCNHYTSTEDRPEVKDFLAKWKAKYGGQPGTTMGALTFDAANLVIEALKKCKELTAKELIAQIDQIENFNGVTGTITLRGQNGDPLKSALVVKVTRTGFDYAKSFSPEELK